MTTVAPRTESSAVLALSSTIASPPVGEQARSALLTDKPPIQARLCLPGGDVLIEAQRPEPTWLYATLHAFKRVAELKDGWDGYGNSAPTDEAIFRALATVVNLLGQESPSPEVVATSSGAVQLEWHEGGMDLEIVASRAGVLSAYHSLADGTDWEVDRVGPVELRRLAAILRAL